MIKINENYQKLQASYLFANIAKRVREYQDENPGRELIRMGIGDVTQPLPEACVTAMHKAVDELTRARPSRLRARAGLRLPARGHRQARLPGARRRHFGRRGVRQRWRQVRHRQHPGAVRGRRPHRRARPGVPVYVDTNVMAGAPAPARTGATPAWSALECTPANGYVPALPPSRST
jgi:LL-diaminopimelate aminotransferase